MKSFLEKFSLLSLSLMMISPFSVSPAIPQMIRYYQRYGYQEGAITLLFSLSSFAILATLLLTPVLSRWLNERQTIISGLLLIALGGTLPVFSQAYQLVFLSRLILGLGIGLINARAISMISERFLGTKRIKMLGYRASAEVLGSAAFTLLAGYLLVFGWSKAFMIYAFSLVILLLYLLFVSKPEPQEPGSNPVLSKSPLSKKQMVYILLLASYAGFVIVVNTATTLRIPVVMTELQIGTASQASLILSLMMLTGILAGMSFSLALQCFKQHLVEAFAILLGLSMLLLWQGDNLVWITMGALLTGYVNSIAVTAVFHRLAERMPSNQLNQATTLVLLGCNLGGGGAALVLQLLVAKSHQATTPYLIFAISSLVLGILIFFMRPALVNYLSD
ncbi:MFS transporter [Streptococcus halichoeri]|uniref:MFS transporter n=1 Tax=Streptococcus halichoeri TaxID=254785 RepID=UPI00135B535B|nr:MFS transporter [Streptococcus halichoeri]